MANVYSKQFLQVANPLAPASGSSAAVPAGYVWDVRDIFAINRNYPTTYGGARQGFSVQLPTGEFLALFDHCQESYPYHWQGRHILSAGEFFYWSLEDAGWTLSVMGYQLTLP